MRLFWVVLCIGIVYGVENGEWSAEERRILEKVCTGPLNSGVPAPGSDFDFAEATLTFPDGSEETVTAGVGDDVDVAAANAALRLDLGGEEAALIAETLRADAACRVHAAAAELGDAVATSRVARRLPRAADGSRSLSVDLRGPDGSVESAELRWAADESALAAAARFLHAHGESRSRWYDRRLRGLARALVQREEEDARASSVPEEGAGGPKWRVAAAHALESLEERLFEESMAPQALVSLEVALEDDFVVDLDLMEGESTREAAASFLDRHGLGKDDWEYNLALLTNGLEDKLREEGGSAPHVMCEVDVTIGKERYKVAHPSHLSPVATARRFVAEAGFRGTETGRDAVPAVALSILRRMSEQSAKKQPITIDPDQQQHQQSQAAQRAKQSADEISAAFDAAEPSTAQRAKVTLIIADEAFLLEFNPQDIALTGLEPLAAKFCADEWIVLQPLVAEQLAEAGESQAAQAVDMEACTIVVASMMAAQIDF